MPPRSPAHLRFLVDTGSDQTLLAPADAEKLGYRPDTTDTSIVSLGVGGPIELAQTGLFVWFFEEDRALGFIIEALVLPLGPGRESAPSLLGRDVLNRCALLSDPRRGELVLDFHSFDQEVNLRAGG